MVVHCVYGIYHLSRKAGGRTAASSAAYQLFSGFSDLCVLPLYAYGTLSIRNNSSGWGTVFDGSGGLQSLVPALYYTLVSAGGLHVLTLGIALWLGLKFRQITLMPPDMNPLEGHLTSRGAARQHKRNKSSVVTNSTLSEGDRPRQERGRSGGPHDDAFGQRTVPFAHTRAGSAVSVRTRDSRIDLPSRQFQGSSPPSPTAPSELSARRLPPPTPRHQENNGRGGRGLYTEIPLHDTNFPSTGTVASSQVSISEVGPGGAVPQQPQRAAKFTEAWYMSESLINRTQQRNRAVNTMLLNATGKRRAYDPLSQANDLDGYYHEDNDDDDNNNGSDPDLAPDADEDVDSDSSPPPPEPAALQPAAPDAAPAQDAVSPPRHARNGPGRGEPQRPPRLGWRLRRRQRRHCRREAGPPAQAERHPGDAQPQQAHDVGRRPAVATPGAQQQHPGRGRLLLQAVWRAEAGHAAHHADRRQRPPRVQWQRLRPRLALCRLRPPERQRQGRRRGHGRRGRSLLAVQHADLAG